MGGMDSGVASWDVNSVVDSGGWIPGDGFQGMESTGEFCEVDSVVKCACFVLSLLFAFVSQIRFQMLVAC